MRTKIRALIQHLSQPKFYFAAILVNLTLWTLAILIYLAHRSTFGFFAVSFFCLTHILIVLLAPPFGKDRIEPKEPPMHRPHSSIDLRKDPHK